MTVCPTPAKVGYRSRAEALVTGRRHGASPLKRGQLKPYRCDCGAWHLTSLSRREHKAILKRRRAA